LIQQALLILATSVQINYPIKKIWGKHHLPQTEVHLSTNAIVTIFQLLYEKGMNFVWENFHITDINDQFLAG